MGRFLGGVAAALLMVAAGLFFWQGRAQDRLDLPPAPAPRLAALEVPVADIPSLLTRSPSLRTPPAATAKTREEKRFGRADKDDDGRITRAEMMAPRQKAFVKLDKNGDGRLAFEEWAVKTVDKFADADDDGNGMLTAAEYVVTAPKARVKTACRC